MIADTQHRLETQPETADLIATLRAQEGIGDGRQTVGVESRALVGAVQRSVGEAELDHPRRSSCRQSVHRVLQQLRDLPVPVSAGLEAVLLTDMLDQQIVVFLIDAQRLGLSLRDVILQRGIHQLRPAHDEPLSSCQRNFVRAEASAQPSDVTEDLRHSASNATPWRTLWRRIHPSA
ncbi:MAG: hypothetical protein IJG47_05730 [Microbacterium sp.]|nr:hypothetical protein [Microbacterium sp.]